MIELNVVRLQKLRRVLRFGKAIVAKIDIGPAGEAGVPVPDALAVSQENESRHVKAPVAARALVGTFVYGAEPPGASPGGLMSATDLVVISPQFRDNFGNRTKNQQ